MQHFDIPNPFTVSVQMGLRSSTELSLEFAYTSHYQAGAGGPARPLLSTIHVPSASSTCAAAPTALPWGGAGCKLRAHFRACDVLSWPLNEFAWVRVRRGRDLCAALGSDERLPRKHYRDQTTLIDGEKWLAHPPRSPCHRRYAVNIQIRAAVNVIPPLCMALEHSIV
jgi:hypothetical protein